MENIHLKSWVISRQDYVPVLILVGKFGVYQSVFSNAYKAINPSAIHYHKLPSLDIINMHIENKHRLIVTSSSLSQLFRWSDLKKLKQDDIQDFCSKILCVELADHEVFTDEEELYDEMMALRANYEDVTVNAYSKNIEYYLNTYNGPGFFIDLLFDNISQFMNDKDAPVILFKDIKYINIGILIKRWKALFGCDCPFTDAEIKRYIWPISKPTKFQLFTGGPSYRKMD